MTDSNTIEQDAAKNPNVETKVDHNYHQIKSDKTKQWEESLPQEYWEYRKKWENNPITHHVGKFPVHIDIEATSNCNLRCTMCPRTDMLNEGKFWEVKNTNFILFKRLIDEGADNGLCSLKFNYLGEPMMNPLLIDMVRYAKEKGLVDVMFNTNATLLTEKSSRKLIEAGLDKLFFSFDSPYRDHYNKIRVNANYDKVLKNIKRFHEIRDEMGTNKPFTRISMVRMKENDQEWEDFKQLFEPIVDAVAWVDYIEHNSQTGSEDKSAQSIDLDKDKTDNKNKKKFCCPQLWQRMFVHPDGVVTVCCVDSARKLTVGNIHGKSVEEIWTGPEYQKLRDLHASGRIDEIPTCANCHLAKTP